MNALTKLASALGRNDERPNVALAEAIVAAGDTKAIAELAVALVGADKAIRHDAIKVLYEVGERAPRLIARHLGSFVALLSTEDNRMVWGAMCAIDAVAAVAPKDVAAVLPEVVKAANAGSVITRDHAVKAMVKLAAHRAHAATVMPLLLAQLRTCPVNQLPMYAELLVPITVPHAKETSVVLSKRLPGVVQASKRKRIERVLKRLDTLVRG
jgi:hypothetical protein